MGRAAAVALLVGLALEAPLPVAAAMFVKGEVDVSAEDASLAPPGGYAPVWMELHSRAAEPRTLELRFQPFRNQGGGSVTRTITIDPGERRIVSLLVPGAMRIGELEVRRGAVTLGKLPLNITETSPAPLLVVGAVDEVAQALGWNGEDERRAEILSVEPRHLPPDLAGYLGIGAVVLLDDPSQLPAPAKSALAAYVRTGGRVVFAGRAAERPVLDTVEARERGTTRVGLGAVAVCEQLESCVGYLNARVPDYRAARAVEGPATNTGGIFEDVREPSLLPGVGRTPVGAFLLIILTFSLAIGPGNLLVARRFGRHIMLITIPALAATTCAGIAGYGIAADGLFTTHFASESVTMLDETTHLASTVAVTGAYAALSPGVLRYGTGVGAAVPKGDDAAITVDWTDGASLGGDWLPSRSYRERMFVASAPSRARLGKNGRNVENALGARLTGGVAKIDGRLVGLPELADGASGSTVDAPATDWSVPLRERLGDRFSRALLDALLSTLAEGDYVAILDGAPMVPTGGLMPTRHPSYDVVRGRFSL